MVIFLNTKKVPMYIKEEFGGESVEIAAVPDLTVGRIHRRFIKFTHFLLWTKTTQRYFKYSRHFVEKPRIVVALYLLAIRVFSPISFLKPLVRKVELLFKERDERVERWFDEYKPDLVFSTSITSKMDNIFMKAARRRGVKIVSMPKSWDTVTKMYYRFVPDYFLAQNNLLKDQLVKLQDFPEEKIFVTGFPQFDWYRRPDIIRSREEHLKKMGLDPNRAVVFFGSQGIWYDKDYLLAEKIYEWIKNDELAKPAQFLVRPHFSNVKSQLYAKYKNMPKASYDDSYRISDDFRDNWDPSVEETIDFVNTMYHADVIVIILSTLALDAACADKSVINILFGAKFRKGKDIMPYMQYTNHYEWVFDTNATFKATNFEELKSYINLNLTNPDTKSKERTVLLEKLCYKVDGKSSERIVNAINNILNKKHNL